MLPAQWKIFERNRMMISRRQRPFYGFLTGLYLLAALAFFLPWLRPSIWREQPITTSALLLIAASLVAASFARWIILPQMKRPPRQDPVPNLRVAVVTTYVRGAEPLEMLEFTLRAFINLAYPHDNWLLDESNDPAAKDLCAKLGVHHFTRRDMARYQQDQGSFRSGTKYGNYNAWLFEIGFSQYDIVVGFDPDHIPCRDFLIEVLGHFNDPQVGYVQAPQAYYNQSASMIARGAAEETYDFNSTIQMASYGMGYPVIVGCHNSHRVRALREAGGFAPHDADDLMLTMLYRNKQWQGVYVPRILAQGLTPVDWEGYLKQQRRWARSVFDLKFRVAHMLTAGLPFRAKAASWLQGLAYLQPGVLFFPAVLALLATIASGEVPIVCQATGPVRTAALGVIMTTCYFYRQQYFLDPHREWGFHWRARLLRVAKAPALLRGVLDVMLGKRFDYVMTPKTASARRRRLLLLPYGTLTVVFGAAWTYGVMAHAQYDESVHAIAAAAGLVCLLLVASEFLPYPPPFDKTLLAGARITSPPE